MSGQAAMLHDLPSWIMTFPRWITSLPDCRGVERVISYQRMEWPMRPAIAASDRLHCPSQSVIRGISKSRIHSLGGIHARGVPTSSAASTSLFSISIAYPPKTLFLRASPISSTTPSTPPLPPPTPHLSHPTQPPPRPQHPLLAPHPRTGIEHIIRIILRLDPPEALVVGAVESGFPARVQEIALYP